MFHLPDTVRLELACEPQQSREWCWCSCAVAVSKFLKIPNVPTEADLANFLTGRTDCATTPTPEPCIIPAGAQDVARVYDHLGIARVGPDLPLTYQTLVNELDAGRPVEVGYLWATGGGHVALVTGYEQRGRIFLVSDPLFGPAAMPYPRIFSAYGIGRWYVSYGRFKRK